MRQAFTGCGTALVTPFTRTGGLARCLPFSLAQIKMASITVPAILAGVWAVLTTAAYRGFGDGAVDRSIPEASLMAVATAGAGHPGLVAGIYIPLIVLATLGSALFMDNLSQARNEKRGMRDAVRESDTWIMSLL